MIYQDFMFILYITHIYIYTFEDGSKLCGLFPLPTSVRTSCMGTACGSSVWQAHHSARISRHRMFRAIAPVDATPTTQGLAHTKRLPCVRAFALRLVSLSHKSESARADWSPILPNRNLT